MPNRLWTNEEREAKTRELFDTMNRVQFAEYLKQNATNPDVAMHTAARVREVYFRQAEEVWPSFRDDVGFYEDGEIKQNLDILKTKEAKLGPEQPKTLMDRFQAGGLFTSIDRDVPGQKQDSPAPEAPDMDLDR